MTTAGSPAGSLSRARDRVSRAFPSIIVDVEICHHAEGGAKTLPPLDLLRPDQGVEPAPGTLVGWVERVDIEPGAAHYLDLDELRGDTSRFRLEQRLGPRMPFLIAVAIPVAVEAEVEAGAGADVDEVESTELRHRHHRQQRDAATTLVGLGVPGVAHLHDLLLVGEDEAPEPRACSLRWRRIVHDRAVVGGKVTVLPVHEHVLDGAEHQIWLWQMPDPVHHP